MELVLIGLVAEARDVLATVAGRIAPREEIVRVVVARPAELSRHLLPLLHALAILAPFVGHELGVDADFAEIGLHHLADALRVGIIRPLHRHVPEVDVERCRDAGLLEERLRLLGIVEGSP